MAGIDGRLRDFTEETLPKRSPGTFGNCWSEWRRAWHGTKLEALYSILFHGRLAESRDEAGGRLFPAARGVHMHKDETKEKADNYMRTFRPRLRRRRVLGRQHGAACGLCGPLVSQ